MYVENRDGSGSTVPLKFLRRNSGLNHRASLGIANLKAHFFLFLST